MSRFRSFRSLLAISVPFILSAFTFADSQARIVRLSEVRGEVQISHDNGKHFEKAMLNLPITQGARLRTSEDALAEIEFEDGSTIRLTPVSDVAFDSLTLADSGMKSSQVSLLDGVVYVESTKAKDSTLSIKVTRDTIRFDQPSHLRVALRDAQAEVAVFKGDVHLQGPAGDSEIDGKHSAVVDLATDQVMVEKGVIADATDDWDKQQDQYHQQNTLKQSASVSPYAYGTSDLNYYGNFFNAPGYGTLWQPYFAGAGWDPFLSGAWGFTPGFGYGWVSAYPWGWLPYHSGAWTYIPAYGWAWQPGAWNGYSGMPTVLNAPSNFKVPTAPTTGTATVLVSRGPQPGVKNGFLGERMVIPKNSAGLGIPRGSLRNMDNLSETASKKGSVQPLMISPRFNSPAYAGPGNSGYSAGSGRAVSGHSTMAPMHSSAPAPSSHGGGGMSSAHR